MKYPIGGLQGVALQTWMKDRQVQLIADGRRIAFQLRGRTFVEPEKTEAIFNSLEAAGVPKVEPVKWMNFLHDDRNVIHM